ncbi:MAG: hypothetical protein LBN05_06210 [Oscillospiraceae bacterium]|nr:hypothetical protein [Oscillospiraceae bacterium]
MKIEGRAPKKRFSPWLLLLTALLLVSSGALVYNLLRDTINTIQTVPAMPGSGTEGFSVTVAALREEIPLKLPEGYTLLVKDGERLAKNAAWAAKFQTKDAQKAYGTLQEKRALRERLRNLQSSALVGLSEAKLEAELSGLFLKFLDSTADGTLDALPAAADVLSEKWSVLEVVHAEKKDYIGDKIRSLDKEIAALEKKTATAKRLTTTAAGYYSAANAPGVGTALADKILRITQSTQGAQSPTLTVAEVTQLLRSKPAASAGFTGNLVTGFNWVIVANIPAKNALLLRLGHAVQAVHERAGGGAFKLTVEYMGREEDGEVPVVFSCADQGAWKLHGDSLRIVLREEEGLRLPRGALHIVEGEPGFFVKTGGRVVFRRAIVRCTEGDVVIVRALSNAELTQKTSVALREEELDAAAKKAGKSRPKSLQRYDAVIVNGRDLEKKINN